MGVLSWHAVHTTVRAVPWTSRAFAGGHSGELVQAVDVLGDHAHGHSGLLELGHGQVCGVGLAWSVRAFLRRICHARRLISGSPM